MNLVDSSGWLEYLIDDQNVEFFAPIILDIENLIVSPINIYEVYKKIVKSGEEEIAKKALVMMKQGIVVDVNQNIALLAAKYNLEHTLPMADSLILATAMISGAVLWTQDSDFKDIPGVQYISKN